MINRDTYDPALPQLAREALTEWYRKELGKDGKLTPEQLDTAVAEKVERVMKVQFPND